MRRYQLGTKYLKKRKCENIRLCKIEYSHKPHTARKINKYCNSLDTGKVTDDKES